MGADPSIEAAALLALAGGAATSARDDVDATRLLQLARDHEVGPLVHWRDAQRAKTQLPPSVATALRRDWLHHSLRNEALTRDLGDVAHALAQRGVDSVFFKGPWLAFAAYPDPGTRPVGDIDLGVRESDFRGAAQALAACGYRAEHGLPRNAAAALHAAHYRRQLRFAARGRRPVELHFRMINVGPPARDERWMWDDRVELAVAGARLRAPGPTAMLLHLLVHANQHGFALLRLLHDIALGHARVRDALDRDALVARVRALRCAASAYHGLVLARELAGATVDPALAEALRPSGLRCHVFARMWDVRAVRTLSARRRGQRVEAPALYLLEMGRWRDKARYLLGLGAAALRGTRLSGAADAPN